MREESKMKRVRKRDMYKIRQGRQTEDREEERILQLFHVCL